MARNAVPRVAELEEEATMSRPRCHRLRASSDTLGRISKCVGWQQDERMGCACGNDPAGVIWQPEQSLVPSRCQGKSLFTD